jgi:hypothetical protein
MSFKILYIEDNKTYARSVVDAVNEKPLEGSHIVSQVRPLIIKSVDSPDKLLEELNQNYDLILADSLFPDPTGEEQNRLDDIIRITREWSKENGFEKPLPIIAYTRREKLSLLHCLHRRDCLYDIWDKASASPPYAAWRLGRIAVELSRSRPDALLERLIRTMESGASWHDHVQDMALRYGNGWTEADQIEQAGRSILDIGAKLNVYQQCKMYWKTMSEWESLGRAVSHRTRGHARHVINVFWLGYYILNDPLLRDWFAGAWKNILADRREMGSVLNSDGLQALNDCWFYAGLFHDVANCIEKSSTIESKAREILGGFEDLVAIQNGIQNPTPILKERADALFHDLGGDITKALKPHWEKSCESKHPDHGVVAAIHLIHSITDSDQHCFAREAARAMVIHNLIGKCDASLKTLLSWEKEPIACMLLLCDQIQTWDRERGDNKLSDKDAPVRAELLELKISKSGDRHCISMAIEYVAPRHLDHAPEIFKRVKDELEEIIEEKPKAALSRIKRPWPFSVSVNCWFSGKALNRKMEF